MNITKQEQDYLDTERMIFDMDTKYGFNPKKCLVEYISNYFPTKELIRILRKKYDFPKGKYNVIYIDMPWEYKIKKQVETIKVVLHKNIIQYQQVLLDLNFLY